MVVLLLVFFVYKKYDGWIKFFFFNNVKLIGVKVYSVVWVGILDGVSGRGCGNMVWWFILILILVIFKVVFVEVFRYFFFFMISVYG